MKPKGWQVAVIVLGAVALGFVVWRMTFGSERVDVPNSYDLVDVETGELFHVADATKTRLILPAVHPVTGKYSLVPVIHEADGKWRIQSTDLGQLGAVNVPIKAVDRESGEVIVETSAVKRYVARKPE